jgi:type IV pilus assembly protein PilY1
MRPIVLTLIGLWWAAVLAPEHGHAQAMADYTAFPPFSSVAVPPNILLILDNSGSMNSAAYQETFDPAKLYAGLFDSLECYAYGSNKFQPSPDANPASPAICPASHPWSGNLLNYAAMRRIDLVKWVMMGGTCSVGGRDAQDNCRQLIGQYTFDNAACCRDQTVSMPVTYAQGRMPATNLPGAGLVYFHLIGSAGSLKGSFCVDDDPGQPTDSGCGDGDVFAESQWQIRVDLFENASGIIQQVGSRARFGLMEFKSGSSTSSSSDGGKVLADVGGNTISMITAIESTTPGTWTPLAESLYEATRYFAQVAPAYSSSDYSYTVTNRDPYYFTQPQWASTSQYVACCKSFAIIFTDGESSQDLNVPSGLQDYAHALHGVHCTGQGCAGHRTDYPDNGTHYLDDVAYYAHITDLRQGTLPVLGLAGKPLDGMQNLTVYTFFAFGQGSELLKSAAKSGGFDDRNGNNLPDLNEEWDRFNNETGAEAADGIPDTYYESTDADRMRDRLMAAITSILQRSASGTSVSVLATSSTGDGALYQAFFYPLIYQGLGQIVWTGYLQGLFLDAFGNIREDTNGDGKLVYTQDSIIRTRFDPASSNVLVDRYQDANGDGRADSPTPYQTLGLRETKGLWEAGRRLALTDQASRTILTWIDRNNDGRVDSTEQIAFTNENASLLAPYLRAGAAPYDAGSVISFIRGTQVSGLRNRHLMVTDDAGSPALRVWKLGDAVYSTPTVVAGPRERYDVIYGDASYTAFYKQYRHRRQVIYMGANDGMLHAFNGGFYHRGDDPATTAAVEHGWFTTGPDGNAGGARLGEELWAYVPYQLLPQLQWLARSDYTHVYYVDLKPKATDVRIFPADADHPNGWGTILIVGFRLGGSCGGCAAATGAPPLSVTANFGNGNETRTFYSAYFVLDVTNPDKPPTLLWSFSEPSLGLTTGYPAVVRINPAASGITDNGAAGWYMIVGSGPTGYDGVSSQTGKLFAVNLATGPVDGGGQSLVVTFATNDAKSFFGDIVTTDLNFDYRFDAAYIGNSIQGTGTPSWVGKLYRLMLAGGHSGPAMWGMSGTGGRVPTVLLESFPASGSLSVGPISAAPALTQDDAGKLWVMFGTRRFYGMADKTNLDRQYFFGIKDDVPTGGCTESSVTSCQQSNLLDVSAASVCISCGSGLDQVTGVAGVTSLLGSATTTLQGKVGSMDGWFTSLPVPGERVLSSPLILGGSVFFTTFVPLNDICSFSGSGALYALFYQTGSAYKAPIIGSETVGSDTISARSMSLGTGLPAQLAVQIISSETGQVAGFVQSSTGALSQSTLTPPLGAWSYIVSWLNQRE